MKNFYALGFPAHSSSIASFISGHGLDLKDTHDICREVEQRIASAAEKFCDRHKGHNLADITLLYRQGVEENLLLQGVHN